ncbi:MAG: hypothetical protein CME06_17865 [Gemmatimonadetes bacterium]|nr:hypothetical protein [Gemmatimonadota bacterium]
MQEVIDIGRRHQPPVRALSCSALTVRSLAQRVSRIAAGVADVKWRTVAIIEHGSTMLSVCDR